MTHSSAIHLTSGINSNEYFHGYHLLVVLRVNNYSEGRKMHNESKIFLKPEVMDDSKDAIY